jgi:hypothetical protein
MLLTTEHAARRNCDVNPYDSARGKFAVAVYTSTIKSIAR